MKSNLIRIVIIFFLTGANITSFSQECFLGNPTRNSNYFSREIGNNVGALWIYKSSGKIYTSPVLADDNIVFGGSDSTLYAINKSKGTLKWKFKTKGEIRSTPAYSDKRLYFGSYDGYFYCLSSSDGHLLWKFKTRGESRRHAFNMGDLGEKDIKDVYDMLQSSPVVYEKMVCFGSGDSSIYSLNKKNGKLIWEQKTGFVVHSSPAFYNNKIYCGSFDGKLYCLNAYNGKVVWIKQTAAPAPNYMFQGIVSSPSVKNGVVYFGTKEAKLYALNAETGAEIFVFSNQNIWIHTSVALANHHAIFSGCGNAEIKSVSIEKGNQEYARRPSLASYCLATPAILNNKFYVGLSNGRFYCLDVDSGKTVWELRTKGNLENKFKTYVENGDLDTNYRNYVLAHPRHLIDSLAVELFERSGAIYSSALIDKGIIYFGSADSNLYAITDCGIELEIEKPNIELKLNKNQDIDTSLIIKNLGPIDDILNLEIFDSELPANNISLSDNSLSLANKESKKMRLRISSNSLVVGKSYKFYVRVTPKSGMGLRTYSINFKIDVQNE